MEGTACGPISWRQQRVSFDVQSSTLDVRRSAPIHAGVWIGPSIPAAMGKNVRRRSRELFLRQALEAVPGFFFENGARWTGQNLAQLRGQCPAGTLRQAVQDAGA